MFESLKQLLLILLFSGTTEIANVPEVIQFEQILEYEVEISAITAGASIQINVTELLGGRNLKNTGIPEIREFIAKRFPPGSIRAVLENQDSRAILDKVSSALSNTDSWIVLSAAAGVQTGIEFTKVRIESDVDLRGAQIAWKNYSL